MILTAPVPIAVAVVACLLLRSLANRRDYQPFFLTLALFALSYAGLGISMYPYIVPQSITIWQAASPENSQLFMLVGVAHSDPDHPRLYRVGLLGVPRQGKARKRLSLMPQQQKPRPLAQRLLWFVALVAWRRRHRRHPVLWPAAVARAELRLSGHICSR